MISGRVAAATTIALPRASRLIALNQRNSRMLSVPASRALRAIRGECGRRVAGTLPSWVSRKLAMPGRLMANAALTRSLEPGLELARYRGLLKEPQKRPWRTRCPMESAAATTPRPLLANPSFPRRAPPRAGARPWVRALGGEDRRGRQQEPPL